MQPQIIEPCEALSPWVKCYWTLESLQEETPRRNTIVPDGCMKLIFHYGDPYKHYSKNGVQKVLPRCFLIGQLTGPYEVEPMGETGTFFVCFHPSGFLPFTSLALKDLENKAVPLHELFGGDGNELAESILKAGSTTERIALSERFLLSQLAQPETIDRIVEAAVETILTANGSLSVEELSRQSNTYRRKLTRKFSEVIGLSPKQLSKTVRLQASLKTLLKADVTNLTSLALDNEYYDQAHFIKDFKEFTGLTPKEFYGDRLKMSLIFESME